MYFIHEGNLDAVLEEFSLSEVLEMCNMTDVEALQFLIDADAIELPPFLKNNEDELWNNQDQD